MAVTLPLSTPAIGAHVPDEVDEKCRETIDAIVRVAVACGYMVTLHDLVGYGDIAFGSHRKAPQDRYGAYVFEVKRRAAQVRKGVDAILAKYRSGGRVVHRYYDYDYALDAETAEDKVSMGMRVDASRTNMLFAEGFADEFLRGDVCDWAELELAMRLSADVRSRVKDALAGGDASSAQRGGANRGGVPVLVAGSAGSGKCVMDGCVESSGIGSGKTVAARDSVSRLAARPDSVLSLNGHTVKVYNPDGVPLSTVIDGRGVSLVNERTGERVRVPTHASHVFFVDGDVWYHYPAYGEPDLVFDNEWTARARLSTMCYCCGAPVDVDGDLCDACSDDEFLCW